jgi:SAM-dependent methyltransferase
MKKRSVGPDAKVPRSVRSALHALRARLKAWSPEKDKEYHEALFARQHYNPFTFDHPGYITIRRFADLTSPFLNGLKTVLDLGCGPGEITCELASRHPGASFMGVDHSPAGIKRATGNAQSLGLNNIVFQVADIEKWNPPGPVDIITMFDAFHHLTNPEAFVRRLEDYSPRFLLVEPRGDWKGSWRRDLDFDWLVLELDKIRARFAYSTGEKEERPPASASVPVEQPGAAVEHRYTLDDFQNIFSGFGLRVRGTVSGLDIYPPGSSLLSPSRERFHRLAYELYAAADEILHEQKVDLLAKHWIVYAEKGLPEERIVLPRMLPGRLSETEVQGAHDAGYSDYDGPQELSAGVEVRARINLHNRSYRVWSSRHPEKPDYLSYHWLDRRGDIVVWDGERTPLPRDIGPQEECDLMFHLKAPETPGRYILALDMVQENAVWFSDAGTPWLRLPFRIRKP